MFGSDYYRYPELLSKSLSTMNEGYSSYRPATSNVVRMMQSLYIRLLGVPEIGFQVRGMYFYKALRELNRFRPKHILDFGSGIGCYAIALARRYQKANVVGFDIDKEKTKIARRTARDCNVSNVTFSSVDIVNRMHSKKEHYDFVITVDVLEHIEDFRRALARIEKMITPGGYLFIHVPQENQKRFFPRFTTWKHEDHAREGFNPSTLFNVLKALGFSITKAWNTFGFFGSLTWEIDHLALAHGPYFAALAFPILYLISKLDPLVINNQGLGIAILARKRV